MIKLAIDVMGGDFGPEVTVPACLNKLTSNKNLSIFLVGNKHQIDPLISDRIKKSLGDRLEIIHTDEQVLMDESPSSALRSKKKSSMRLAINLVKEKQADACVSAGNTGALMAISHYILKTIPGIDRAAIIGSVPTIDGKCRLLDMGATLDTNAEQLVQFAIMGNVIAETIDGIDCPKVALLNVGSEEMKGNDQVKQTAILLNELEAINYIGFVEGGALFVGGADVIVCNGFIGNVGIKAGSGMAKMIKAVIQRSFRKNLIYKIIGLIAYPVLKAISKEINPSQHNGATLLGLNGIVIKSHGGADSFAFEHAIAEAISEVKYDVTALISKRVGEII